MAKPKLTEALVLAWADAHFAKTGRRPHGRSGPVAEAPGETWEAVQAALKRGCRGLPGGDTLLRLLRRRRPHLASYHGAVRGPDPGKRRRVAELRAQGLSVPKIAARLGVSRQAVWQMLQRVEHNEKAGR
jgi:hypothetical protein